MTVEYYERLADYGGFFGVVKTIYINGHKVAEGPTHATVHVLTGPMHPPSIAESFYMTGRYIRIFSFFSKHSIIISLGSVFPYDAIAVNLPLLFLFVGLAMLILFVWLREED